MKKRILLIEDNDGDIKLFEEALKENDIDIHLDIFTDGEQAIEYIEKVDTLAEDSLPDLIILDLNLPRVDGKKVLQYFKSNEKTKVIPVIILSTSKLQQDIHDCYAAGANSFLTKPLSIMDFFDLIKSIDDFWLQKSYLPTL
jgi:CheY-like chemotaxis protein